MIPENYYIWKYYLHWIVGILLKIRKLHVYINLKNQFAQVYSELSWQVPEAGESSKYVEYNPKFKGTEHFWKPSAYTKDIYLLWSDCYFNFKFHFLFYFPTFLSRTIFQMLIFFKDKLLIWQSILIITILILMFKMLVCVNRKHVIEWSTFSIDQLTYLMSCCCRYTDLCRLLKLGTIVYLEISIANHCRVKWRNV